MKTKNTLWAAGAVLVLSLSAFVQNVKHDAVAQPAAEKTADCGDPPTARPVRRTDGWWAKGVPERHLAAIAANKSGHFDLVMVGDSITHRWMQKDKGGAETWPQLTNEFSVLNLGIGADRTQHVLWRLLHGELDGYTADVFTLLIGVNNTGTDSAEDIAEGTRRIVALIREKHPESTILLMPILPHGKNPSDPGSTTARANSITRALADGDKVRIFDIRNKFLGPDGKLLPGMMAADDLHPIEGGYRVWYDSLVPEVRKLMGRPGGGFAMRVSGPRPIPRPALLRRLKCGPEVIGIVHWDSAGRHP